VEILETGETITVVDQFQDSPSWDHGVGLELITFADGSQYNRSQIQQNAWFRGTDGSDVIDVRFSALDDTIEGGKGDDIIYTGLNTASGSDTIVYSKGDGNDTIYEQTYNYYNETDTLFLTDIDASEVSLSRSGSDLLIHVLPTNETITVVTQFVDSAAGPGVGLEVIKFADGTIWNRSNILDATSTFTWAGSSTNAKLTGNDYGSNIFQLGAGDETANGGARSNVFQVTTSTKQAEINLSSAKGSQNEIDFLGGISDESLWFEQSGNDLKIDLLGTNTSVTISDWFSGSASALQEITAGALKIDSQISQLVQAMASYSTDNPGFDPTSSSIHTLPNDSALQNAVAAAWH